MKEISLCMIVKDEELVIGRCLESVKDIADEIIIVDTGSTDKTKEIVSKYTDKVYDFEWIDDFAKARNFSFSKATKEYIMWLDADDVILEKDRIKLKELKANDERADIFMMFYNYAFDNEGKPTIIQKRARLLRRDKNYQWVSPIHEVIIPTGNIVYTDICISHKKVKINDKDRNLRILRKLKSEGYEFDSRQQYVYAQELKSVNINEAIEEFQKNIDGKIDDYQINQYFVFKSLIELADCYKQIKDIEKEKETLFKILYMQEPYIEVTSRLGDLFFREKNYDAAIFWLNQTITIDKEMDTVNDYERYFLPYIELGICYYYKSDFKKAMEYNELAGKHSMTSEAYKKNKEIYENALKNSNH